MVTSIKLLIRSIASLGLDSTQNILEQRRIRLTNTFALAALVIILIFSILNLAIGDYLHSLKIITGMLFLVLPVLFLNYKHNFRLARGYFVVSAIGFANFVGYSSILDFEQRLNETIIIGISAFILVLYDGNVKKVMFTLTVFSTLAMHIFRWHFLYDSYNLDLVMALSNILIAFVCIYVFTSMFRIELEKSLSKVERYSEELHRQRDKLTELNSTKDRLISIVSHDLKSPINTLKGLMQQADHIAPEKLDKLMRTIRGQVSTISFTLENLLGWVRTQLDGFTVSRELLNVWSTVQECAELYQPEITTKEIRLDNQVKPDELIYADANNMALVFRNLLSNAMKFTPNKGTITIATQRISGNTIISFVDSGVGMGQEQIDHIFKRKSRTTTKGTNGELGTGLGLSFCLDILSQNDAEMHINSKPNEGTKTQLIFRETELANVN